MRLFVGLPVPPELARALAGAAGSIELPKGRRTLPEDMHLTLAFLGEADESLVELIKRELSGLRFSPLKLRLAGLGTFPRAGVLFAEIEPAAALLKLQARVAEAMRRCGFDLDERPYRPHLTVARFHGRLRLGEERRILQTSLRADFRVATVNLYRSTLSQSGARYEVVAQKRSD